MVAGILASLLELFLGWLYLFAAPFLDPSLLWIIVPVYISWVFNEFYQEKIGTSFGNAITNGAVLIWAGVDWARTTTGLFHVDAFGLILFKFILCFISVALGIFIIIEGVHMKRIVKFLGRSRNITYFILVFTPFVYNVAELSIWALIVIILFFPIYYLVIEIIDRIIPNPKIYQEDNQNSVPDKEERKTLNKEMEDKLPKEYL